jgi:nucleoside-diphosphate-sugar epimerase
MALTGRKEEIMKVLISGADGYIGVLLAATLMERGHDVTGLDTGFYNEGWLYDGAFKPQVTIREDVRSVTADELKGFEAVVHLAELSNDPLGENNPKITYQINHQGSVNLAKKCKQAGVQRFLYSSSCSVYGAGSEEYVTEESATAPQTAYARCKLLVERDLAGLADDDFSPTVLRNATAYGPSPRMRFDLVLNNLAGLAWTTDEIKMTSDGTPWRPLVHVLDICEAMACALEAPRELVHNQIFNVGDTRQNYRVKEIAEIVAATFPDCKIIFGQSDGDRRSYRVCFDKISARLTGFRCQRDARAGAEELRELFERTHLSHEMFVFRTFTRLKQLDYLVRTRQINDFLFWQPTAA